MIQPGDVPPSFFIIIKGVVEEIGGGEVVALHGTNDCFDVGLLVERQCRNAFVVREEAICYLLPLDELLDLTANNKAFAEFFYRDLSHKLDAFVGRQTIGELQPVMIARVRDGYLHPPHAIPAATSIAEAVAPDEGRPHDRAAGRGRRPHRHRHRLRPARRRGAREARGRRPGRRRSRPGS